MGMGMGAGFGMMMPGMVQQAMQGGAAPMQLHHPRPDSQSLQRPLPLELPPEPPP